MSSATEMPTAETPTYDLDEILKTDWLTDLDKDIVQHALSSPSFVVINGVHNSRDIGAVAGSVVRKGYIFRSATLGFIYADGKLKLASELGVKVCFDLQTYNQREKNGIPLVDGVDFRVLSPARELPAPDLEQFLEDDGIPGMMKMFDDMLESHAPFYRAVFEQIRDHHDEPILFYCDTGKESTSVLAALIHQIAGSTPEVIAHDYALSHVGLARMKYIVREKLPGHPKPNFSSKRARQARNFCGSHSKTMIQFLKFVGEKFEGGAEGYAKEKLGFSEDDSDKIRKNLTMEEE
ncbi:hypothetical protein AJ80_06319 [Polytolypa hystricis UAMH7299]|uniref:Tyrosine specific protein phosphatases domain-containing protein n=1 Tax=Polytolypa hystricis (strain UAMH7299) TaxID=1447883 RepID=A0A2B7XWS0_POLH7|nr:hypothetical protein AJ80_06319 [Polytolypa hystricis UAMH7299]